VGFSRWWEWGEIGKTYNQKSAKGQELQKKTKTKTKTKTKKWPGYIRCTG